MNFSPNKILIVEDRKLKRDTLHRILIKLGYTVEFAENAETALKIIANEKTPMVITDLLLPDMDGAELCKRIKKIHSASVVYALSGYVDAFGSEHLEKIGFDGFMRKPVKIHILMQAIKGAFERIDVKKKKTDRVAYPA